MANSLKTHRGCSVSVLLFASITHCEKWIMEKFQACFGIFTLLPILKSESYLYSLLVVFPFFARDSDPLSQLDFFSRVNVLHFGAIFCTSEKMPFWVRFRFCALGISFRQYFFSKHPLSRISDRIRGSTHQEGSNNASFIRIRSVVWT